MEVMIGLETHCQLNTESKVFCQCKNPVSTGGKEIKPNTLTCECCLGMPGSKPVLNEKVVEYATKVAIALNCKINKDIFFSRKTYFYPDMSKNFQITQYEIPLAENGFLEIDIDGKKKKIRITRLHIEEDPAKLVHIGGMGGMHTLVDYNRSGTPLIEIVTEPDFNSPKEARIYLQKLSMILEYLNVYELESDASIKSDANLSIKGHQRTEVKNITGTKEIERALSYEALRQKNMIKRGREITQETRAWNPDSGTTRLLRTKETEEDYGYIFEPDLTVIEIPQKLKERLRNKIPELPDEKRKRFVKQYCISEKAAESLVSEKELADLFEKVSKKVGVKIAASWIAGPFKKTLNWNGLKFISSGIKEEWISDLLVSFKKGELSDHSTEMVLRKMVEDKKNPQTIIKKYEFGKTEKKEDIQKIVQNVLENNKQAVKDYKSGEEKALHFLVGQVMRESKGSVDAKTARKMIEEKTK